MLALSIRQPWASLILAWQLGFFDVPLTMDQLAAGPTA